MNNNKPEILAKGEIVKLFIRTLLILAACSAFSSLFAAVDLDPKDIGTTLARNVTGSAFEASFYNPALLGVDHPPTGGVLLVPLTDAGFGYWSDKLCISPFMLMKPSNFDSANISQTLSHVLAQSFNITDADMADPTGNSVSKKLTDGFKGGFNIYAGGAMSLLSIANKNIAFDVTTHVNEQLHMPEGPLELIFSGTKGLLEGNTLDFSTFKQEAVWTTDFKFSVGLPLTIPALNDFFKLKYSSGGLAVKYVMGHSYLDAEMVKGGTVTYNADQSLAINGDMNIRTAGTGMHGDFIFDQNGPFHSGMPIAGHGIGIDLGGILYDDDASLSINIANLGVLFWMNNTREVDLKINKNDLRLYDIIQAVNGKKQPSGLGDASLTIFNRNENEYLSGSNDTLQSANGFVTSLPLTVNIGYSYKWDFEKMAKDKNIKYLAQYAIVATNYEQSLTSQPGMSYIPRISIGSEAGVLNGFMPIRMGFVVGGSELIGSALGMGFNFKYFSIHGSYKAIGTPYFYPSRGVELAGGINVNWGVNPKQAPPPVVVVSKCLFTPPANFSGVLDKDGCPNPDQDKDSICDPWVTELHKDSLYAKVCHGVDKCPTKAEDYDGFEDNDGCPDYDNDKDGIPDSLDKCPNEPEDMDGFEDKDGCPDYDNDRDGVPDSLDKCPNQPEDIDGFQDKDGCPDFDNDKDGIADTLDKCPNEPETYNGYKDEDGCPDTLPKPTAKEEKALNKALRAINFKTASAELTEDSYTALNSIVAFLKQYPFLKYEIQGHTDSRGNDDYNLLLSAARAASVRYYLVSQSVPDSVVIAIGYGKTRPIESNNTAQGRALNRRVEFKVIEQADEYRRLLLLEADFKERVRSAQIKGAK